MFADPDGEHLVGLSYARHPVRVLGVDPGLTRCGIGVVEGAPGRALTMVRVGVIRTSAEQDIAARLLSIETEIEAWLDACRPDAVAVERVFSQQNVRTVMGTAQAGAIAIAAAARRGLPVALHTPSEVKAAVTGNGRADKDQVTAMVTRLLRATDPPRPADAADALALAICHIWRGGGAGLRVQCTPGTLATLKPGEPAQVATSLVVREDSLTLYGFVSDDERNVFELLQTASGVGPRLALAMLAVFSPDGLRRAVAAEDVAALTRVPGIGRKGAQRIVLELAGRLGSPGDGTPAAAAAVAPAAAASWRDQVRTGLVNLGW